MKVSTSGRKSHPLATRIKRLMQKDDEVGRIASVTPILIGRSLELFLRKLCTNVIDYAQSHDAKILCTSHLKACICSDEMMDFLKDIVKDTPDLQAEASDPPASKRPRSVVEGTLSQRGGRRGRGYSGTASKRVCMSKLNSSETPTPTPHSSVFTPFTQRGPETSAPVGAPWKASLPSLKSRSLQINLTESKSLTQLEKDGRVSSLPTMTSAIRSADSMESHVDPNTLPIGLQKALLHVRSTEAVSSHPSESFSNEMQEIHHKPEIKVLPSTAKKRSFEDSSVSQHPSSHQSKPIVTLNPNEPKKKTIQAEDDDYDLEDDVEDGS